MISTTQKVLERFGGTGEHWSVILEDGEDTLRSIVSRLFPSRYDLSIVEIGTHQGVSAAILSDYGRVDTYDLVNWGLRDEMLEFLGVESSSAMVEQCCHAGSFEKLSCGRIRGHEDRNAFFRKGIIGDWKNHFDQACLDSFMQYGGDLMRELGYE